MSKSGSLARTALMSSLVSHKGLWIWPIMAAFVLGGMGWWIRGIVENNTRVQLADELKTILNADVAALRIWLRFQESHVQAIADEPHIRALIRKAIAEADEEDATAATLLQSETLARLRQAFQPWITSGEYAGFGVIDRGNRFVASSTNEWILQSIPPEYTELMGSVLEGKPTVMPPNQSRILLRDADGQLRAGVPTMFALAPVRDEKGQILAVLGMRIRPEDDFTRILDIARAGESGETYAFNAEGMLLSESRFTEELKQIGLVADRDEARSMLNLHLRDPEVDMTRGKRPAKRRAEQRLTRAVASAISGEDGVDVYGYNDYRGVRVVGAWTWLPEYGFGVVTKVDAAEAFHSLHILRLAFGILFLLLIMSAVAIFVFSIIAARLQRKARRAALEARQLGQYTLDAQIGSGGMGVVYRAHHAMLQRPTAVKLLDVDKTNETTIARFEREVRLTSQLNHPNTVAVYDFGRTPEGVFYYAMEYLDGITLDQLVKRFGPQPEGRVIHILTQVCGSLVEAHGVGLIHRDIKPANIILNRRGGIADFVKLLDFGLVKAVDARQDSNLTAAGVMTGTPLYLSPEGIQQPNKVDARSDLYAVGAVGYYLLTGTPMFDGGSVIDICMHQANTLPEPPSIRLGKPVSPELEKLLMRCLAKDSGQRPQSAAELAEALRQCPTALEWTEADAILWWQRHGKTLGTPRPTPSPSGSDVTTTLVPNENLTREE